MKLKIIAMTVAVVILHITLKAQRVQIGLAPEINFPTGNASNISSIGFGGVLMAEAAVAQNYAVSASVGYSHFIGKKYFGNRVQNISAFPVKLGVKYYSSPDFYIEGQVGAAFQQGSSSKTSLIWSPGFGTYLKTNNVKQKIALGLRYEAWENTSYNSTTLLKSTSFGFIGLKLGYQFGL